MSKLCRAEQAKRYDKSEYHKDLETALENSPDGFIPNDEVYRICGFDAGVRGKPLHVCRQVADAMDMLGWQEATRRYKVSLGGAREDVRQSRGYIKGDVPGGELAMYLSFDERRGTVALTIDGAFRSPLAAGRLPDTR